MESLFPASFKPYFAMAQSVAIAIAIFIVGWILSKFISRLVIKAAQKKSLDVALSRFLSSLIRYTILIATLIASLGAVGIQTTSLVAIFASAGLAVGLALQGTLGHFASGVMILFFRPFTIGDVVTAAGSTGVVHDIGLFATTLKTPANETIIVPNGKVTGGVIINITTAGTRRGAVEVGVAYGTDVAKVITVLTEAVSKLEIVLEDPAPAVAFTGLGASSLDFTVLTWGKSADYLGMLHDVRQTVYDSLNGAGIEIPFNQIVVHQAQAEAA